MKNSLRFLFASIVLVSVSTAIFAQNSANTTAQVTSTLLTNLAITKGADVAFGQIASGTIPTLSASSSTVTAVGANAALGKFTVIGTSGATVKITYDNAVELDHSGGASSGKLTFTPSVYRTALTSALYGATSILSSGTYTINSSATNAVVGTDHIFVGGQITEFGTSTTIPALSSSLQTGNYSGTFNITATYN